MENGRVTGLFARSGIGSGARLILFRARAVILATGGLGALYAVTTNPLESRGEGLGMAARAGALIADPEFVQFHPTAIAVGRDPAPLATEALRGEGAVLVNAPGRALHERDPSGRRAGAARYRGPRHSSPDRVGTEGFSGLPRGDRRGISRSISPPSMPPAWPPASIRRASPFRWRPPRITTWAASPRDIHGRSSLPGLWVVGECASTGLHGANRLASNSLLEGLVFGARAADDVRGQLKARAMRGIPPGAAAFRLARPAACAAQRHDPRRGPGTRRRRPARRPGRDQAAGTHQHRAGLAEHGGGGQAGHGRRPWRGRSRAAAIGAPIIRKPTKTGTRTFMTLADAERIAAAAKTAPRRASQ